MTRALLRVATWALAGALAFVLGYAWAGGKL